MKLLVDAQLPKRLARHLHDSGHDAIHTADLPDGNRTPDDVVSAICLNDQRIVVTKDDDFVNSFLLRRQPPKLLLVSTGNIRNAELFDIFIANLALMEAAFQDYDYVELTRTALVIHI